MGSAAMQPSPTPERSEVIPDSYGVYVNETQIHVWQYRVNVSAPDGEWYFVETLDRDDDPRLTISYAMVTPPTAEGYWIYSTTYDCELACE